MTSTLYERIHPDINRALSQLNVAIIGIGSGGSYIAEQLLRSGVLNFSLVDPDSVEERNLSRTNYSRYQIGFSKVEAQKAILENINETASINIYHSAFEELGARLEALFEENDIVVAATDSPRTQQKINRCAFYTKTPVVFSGLYRGADGGEVAAVLPGLTPCFECMVPRERFSLERGNLGELDYGTDRLKGEVALSCDIHHLASVSVKLIIAIAQLLDNQLEHKNSKIILEAINNNFHMLLLSMTPDYFPKDLFPNVGGQLAYQGTWVSFPKRADCPICGDNPTEENPFIYVQEPDIDQLRSRRNRDD